MRERIYDLSSRNKLARNKYGIIYNDGSYGGLFGASDAVSSSLGGVVVGGDLSNFEDFGGATASTDGTRGIVPAPLAGMQDWFLQGDGTWTDIPAARWLTEFPEGDGLEKSGLQIDGDFRVKDRLITKDLEVEGQAHFWELVIDKVSANGGQVFISPSLFHIDYLGTIIDYPLSTDSQFFIRLKALRSDIYELMQDNQVESIRCRRIYMRCDNTEKRILNEVNVGDMLRCRTFNVKPGVYHNVKNKDYWTFVVETGEQTVTDDAGEEHPCIWCDIAYALKVDNHINIHFGSTLTKTGIISPDGETIYDVNELKKRTRQTLDEETIYFNENPSKDEYNEIYEDVFTMIGFQSMIQKYILGIDPYGTYTDKDDIVAANNIADEIVEGDGLDDTQMSGLIIDGQITDDDDSSLEGGDTTNGTDLSDIILGHTNTPAGYSLEIIDANDKYDNPGYINITDANTGEVTTIGVDEYYDEMNPETTTDDTFEEYRSSWLFCYGELDTDVEDDLVCFGHLWDEDRMNVIVLSSITPMDPDLRAPSMAQYNGIDKFGISLSDYRQTAIAKNGNEFYGKFLVEYNGRKIEVGEQVNLFINDLKTGLEKCGIHIDGENSRITMVGNVELRQNNDGELDTLKVIDEENNIRVEITPDQIPDLEDIEGRLGKTEYKNNSYHGLSNPYYGVLTKETFSSGILWWKEKYYKYTLETGKIKKHMCAHIDLGDISNGVKIALDSLRIVSTSKLYFMGNKEMDRGLVTQRVKNLYVGITDLDVNQSGIVGYDEPTGYWENTASPTFNGLNENVFVYSKNYDNYFGQYMDLDNNRYSTKYYYDRQMYPHDITVVNTNNFVYDNTQLDFGRTSPTGYPWSHPFLYVAWDEEYGASTFYSKDESNPFVTLESDVAITAKIRLISNNVENIKGKTTIGSDGVTIVNGTNKFLYVGDSGIVGRWGNYEMSLSDEGGAKISGGYQTIYDNSEKDYISGVGSCYKINISASFVDATPLTPASPGQGKSNDLRLPSASEYGIGRMLTIIGNDTVNVYTMPNEVMIYTHPTDRSNSSAPGARLNPFLELTSLQMSYTYQLPSSGNYYRWHNNILTLVSNGSAWYITNIPGDIFNGIVSVLYP